MTQLNPATLKVSLEMSRIWSCTGVLKWQTWHKLNVFCFHMWLRMFHVCRWCSVWQKIRERKWKKKKIIKQCSVWPSRFRHSLFIPVDQKLHHKHDNTSKMTVSYHISVDTHFPAQSRPAQVISNWFFRGGCLDPDCYSWLVLNQKNPKTTSMLN